MAAISGKNGKVVYRTKAAVTPITAHATTEVTTTRFQMVDHYYLDPSTTTLVYVDAVLQTTGYTVEYAGGFVVFDASQTGKTITVTGAYWTMADLAQIGDWKLGGKTGKADCTPFGTTSGVHRVSTAPDFSGSFSHYWMDSDYVAPPGDTDSLTGISGAIVLNVDASKHYEGYAILDFDVDCAPDEVVKGSFSFEGDGMYYYRAT